MHESESANHCIDSLSKHLHLFLSNILLSSIPHVNSHTIPILNTLAHAERPIDLFLGEAIYPLSQLVLESINV